MQKFTFKDIILLLVICEFVCLCECILCVFEHLQRPSGGNKSSESGVTGSGEPHNGVLVMEPIHLEEDTSVKVVSLGIF